MAKLWVDAQNAAQNGFSELIENATTEILKYKIETEASRKSLSNIQDQLSETKIDLENVKKQLSETNYLIRLNTETLAIKENALKSLEIDKTNLIKQLDEVKQSFSNDLVLINELLHKAEFRYTNLEKKSLLEIDSYRQQYKKTEKTIIQLEKLLMIDKAAHSKANERKQAQLNSLSEKLGKCQGQYEALKAEKKLLIKRLTNNKH